MSVHFRRTTEPADGPTDCSGCCNDPEGTAWKVPDLCSKYSRSFVSYGLQGIRIAPRPRALPCCSFAVTHPSTPIRSLVTGAPRRSGHTGARIPARSNTPQMLGVDLSNMSLRMPHTEKQAPIRADRNASGDAVFRIPKSV